MNVIQKSFIDQTVDELLAEWSDPLFSKTMDDAEELIHKLQIKLAGKEEVIKHLYKDIEFYKNI